MDLCVLCGKEIAGLGVMIIYHKHVCVECQRHIAGMYAATHLDPVELLTLKYSGDTVPLEISLDKK